MRGGPTFRLRKEGRTSGYKWMAALLLFLAIAPEKVLARFTPPPYDLARLEKAVDLTPWMAWLPDPERRLNWRSALAGGGWQPLNEPRLGYLDYPVWTRLKVINTGKGPKTAILYNERPLLQYLEVRVLEGDKVVEQARLGFMDPSRTEATIAGRLSSMSLQIPAGGTKTVLARLETPGAMEAGWGAATVAAFSQKTMTEFIVLGLYAGIMLSLIIHGLVNWISLRRTQFGFFVGYALCFLLFGLSVNGFSRVVSLGLSPGLWFAACFLFIMGSVACFLPFTRYFLDTSQTMPRMDRWLRILGILFAACLVFFVLAPFFPRIYILTPFWAGCTLVAYASVLLAGALAVRKRLPYARLYLIGDASAFTATGTMAALAQTTLIHRFGTTLLILPWIVIIHVLVLSLSLVLMARLASGKLAREREHNLEQSRFTIMGQTIGMVVHQWRTPLARLGTQLAELDAYFRTSKFNSDYEAVIRRDLLPAMHRSMRILTDTVDDFSDFFSAGHRPKDYDPNRVIHQVLEMVGGRCARLGIAVQRPDISRPLNLHGHPHTLAHVLMVVLENALDVLETRQVLNPQVTLNMEETEKAVVLTVADNGGGIPFEPIDRVFETFVSDKGKHHMGMGLGMARRLVEERMNGTIRAENRDGGSLFTLTLPNPHAMVER